MLEWKSQILMLMISLIGILDRLSHANNWNW